MGSQIGVSDLWQYAHGFSVVCRCICANLMRLLFCSTSLGLSKCFLSVLLSYKFKCLNSRCVYNSSNVTIVQYVSTVVKYMSTDPMRRP